LTKAGKSGKVMGEVVENALKYADEIPDIGRAAGVVAQAVDKGGDVGRAASEFADTVRRIAGEVADPDVAKALSNMGKQADKFVSTGAKSLGLAPTRAAQAAAGERALVNFAGIPVVSGEGVFGALGKGGQALRGSTLGKAVGDIFDYGAPLRKAGIGGEDVEKIIEGQRSLPSTQRVAREAAQTSVDEALGALPEAQRNVEFFEQSKRLVPTGSTKTREIVEPAEELAKKGAKQADELSETKRLVEYQDEIIDFRPDMTPEQVEAVQKHSAMQQEYLEIENAHNIKTKQLTEMSDPEDILDLLQAGYPTDYAHVMRSDAAWDYIRKNGEEAVNKKLKTAFESAPFTKQRSHREAITVRNKYLREKMGIDFDWFETDILKIDRRRAALHAQVVERAKMLEDWSKIKDLNGNPIVQILKEGDEVAEGMQRLPGAFDSFAVKGEVIDFLDRVAPKYSEDGIKTFTELLEMATSVWRGYATATPGFIGRNAISNFWQLFLKDGAQGLNPRRAWLTAEWMMGKNLDASIVTKSGKIIDGHTFMREATKHNIFEVGIMGSLAPTEEAGGALGTAAKAGGGADEAAKAGLSAVNPLSREFFPVKGIRSINTKVEQHAKAMGYLNDLMKGDSFADAAINTKKFLFDYCVDDKTEILTARGWQTIYTLQYGDEVLTLNLNNDNVKWSPIQSIFCRPYADELNHITSNRFDAMVTDNHRWVKKRTCSSRPLGFTTTQEATKKKMILKIAGGDYKAPKKAAYSDEFVELVGWYITEGWFQKYGQGVQIAQSSKRNPKYVERIRKLAEHFNTKGATVSEYTRDVGWGDIHSFYFGKGIGRLLREAAPGKELRPEFLLSLTKKQLLLLYKTLMDGDGTRDKRNKNGDPHERWTQFDEQRQDGFQMLCALLGKRTHNRDGHISVYKSEDIYTNSLKTEKVYYKGPIWCVTTADGTWFARRNGVTYWTGNSRLTPKEKVLRTYAPFMCLTKSARALTKEGYKTYKELQIGEDILTLNTNTGELEWKPVQGIFSAPYNGQMIHLRGKSMDTLCTPNHRWVIRKNGLIGGKKYMIQEAWKLRSNDSIITIGDYKPEKDYDIPDDILWFIGWLCTDGYCRLRGNHREYIIYQDPKKFASEIRKRLSPYDFSEKPHPQTGVIAFRLKGDLRKAVEKHYSRHADMIPLVLKLSRRQLDILYDSMYKADGTTSERDDGKPHCRFFAQRKGPVKDAFQMLCFLRGEKAKHTDRGMYIRNHGKYVKALNLNPHVDEYQGVVWCPKTENHTWVAQDNGGLFATGNTWTRKNIPLQVEQLIAQPGKFAGVGKVRRSAMDAFSDPETGQYTPGYFDELFAIPTPFNIGGGQMWLNPDLPFQDLQTLTQPKDLWGMLNPLLKAPVELGMDKEMFFGRPIQGEEGRKVRTPAALRWLENIPGVSGLLGMDKIRDYYSEDPNAMTSGMNPRLDYLFRQIPMLNTLSKIMDFAAPTEKHVADALSGGLGVKFYQFNPEVEKTSVGWENVQKYQDFMNILQKQYGVDIPSTDTLERFLRYLYGQPVESEYALRKQDPSLDYLAYLQKVTGIMPPYSLEDIEAFKQMYDVGDVTLPGTASSKASSPISVIPNMVKGQSKDPLKSWKAKMRRQYGIKF
ncbi:MAG: hypothetical protein WC977_09355, partial [Anaerovoracaceae bacterium]